MSWGLQKVIRAGRGWSALRERGEGPASGNGVPSRAGSRKELDPWSGNLASPSRAPGGQHGLLTGGPLLLQLQL